MHVRERRETEKGLARKAPDSYSERAAIKGRCLRKEGLLELRSHEAQPVAAGGVRGGCSDLVGRRRSVPGEWLT